MKKMHIFLFFIFVVVIFFIINPGSTTTYNNTYYSFEYPNAWDQLHDSTTYHSYGSNTVLYPDYSKYREHVTVVVTGPEIEPDGFNLEEYGDNFTTSYGKVYPDDINDTEIDDPRFKVLLKRTFNVNGMKGVDIAVNDAELATLTSPREITEEVYLQKGNKLYEIRVTCSSEALEQNPNIFNETHDGVKTIINSLKPT